ncbi:MAG: FoF1 ATP synthase subunit a [Anaerolineae bacterium]
MRGWIKILIYALVFIAIGVLLKMFIPFGPEAVGSSVTVSPEVLFNIPTPFGNYPFTNTILTAWIVMLLLALLAYLATRKMELIPSGLQNVMEFALETMMGLADSVAGERARKFFVVTATIFIFVLFSNLIGLIPGFGPIGTITLEQGQQPPQGIVLWGDAPWAAPNPAETGVPILAPFVRAPSTDVNLTLAIALVAMFLVEAWGFQANGFFGYLGRFFRFGMLGEFFGGLFKGKIKIGQFFMGLIDFFVGLIELVSEFAKIIAFTFRLFGNIFAGEIVLLIMAFLFAALPLIFYGFELFVGFIQAFVFFILSLAFMTIATTPHQAEGHH